MALLKTLVLALMPVAALGLQERATPDMFSLWAFGPDTPGQPLFFADGYAYVGDVGNSNSSDASTIAFYPGDDKSWIGTLTSNNVSSSAINRTFTLPGPYDTDKRIRLPVEDSILNLVDDGIKTNFVFYGSTAMHQNDDGGLETLFYARKIDDAVSALYWNDTNTESFPVALRYIAPSNPTD